MSEFNSNGQAARPQQAAAAAPAAPRQAREYYTKRQTLMVAFGAAAVAVLGVGCVLGVHDAVGVATRVVESQLPSGSTRSVPQQQTPQQGGQSGQGYGYGFGGGQSGSGSNGLGSGSGSGSDSRGGFGQNGDNSLYQGASATADEAQGVVLINTQLGYQNAEAAGTGMVLTSSGEILTNNHVVEGSTSISVEIVSTGASYTATVVGTDAADDVAVLQLKGASGLTVADLDRSGTVAVGDDVTGVGNAGGTGTLTAAPGEVTALGAHITTEAEASAASESLSGLIQTNADIQAGDSGGPLYDADGQIVGMDTAASTGGEVEGYAIPITSALKIADRIDAGETGDGVTLGYPAFLGIEVQAPDASGLGSAAGSAAGAPVGAVISGTPAAQAGLEAGDLITGVDGHAVASSDALTQVLSGYAPGDRVTVTFTDAAGQSHSAAVTLATGPAA